MRPVAKGTWPTINNGRRRIFNDWRRAKPFLRSSTGDYCHLCEMRVTNALAIEHIKPKEHFPKLSNHWDNFLLICNYCNSHKLETIPSSPYRKKYFWPHLNNTLQSIDYSITGIAIPNTTYLTNPDQLRRANATIQLYGLDKTITATGDSDTRLIERLKAFKMAIDRKIEYAQGQATEPAILDMAKTTGFFSIWLKVFNNVPAIRTAIIQCPEFHQANTNCFDAAFQLQNRTATDL